MPNSRRLPLTDIWGIAGRLARRLTELGIDHAACTQTGRCALHPRAVQRYARTHRARAAGHSLHRARRSAARPQDDHGVAFVRPLVTARREMEEAVASYATRAAENAPAKSRRRRSWCSCRPTLSAPGCAICRERWSAAGRDRRYRQDHARRAPALAPSGGPDFTTRKPA